MAGNGRIGRSENKNRKQTKIAGANRRYVNPNLYQYTYLHSSLFTFRSNADLRFQEFSKVSTKDLLKKVIAHSKKNFKEFYQGLGLSEAQFLNMLRYFCLNLDKSKQRQLIKNYYKTAIEIIDKIVSNKGEKFFEEYFIESLGVNIQKQFREEAKNKNKETVPEQVELLLDFDPLKPVIRKKHGKEQEASSNQKLSMRYNIIKKMAKDKEEELALSIFFMGNEHQGLNNLTQLIELFKKQNITQTNFDPEAIEKWIDDIFSVLSGKLNEQLLPLVTDKLTESIEKQTGELVSVIGEKNVKNFKNSKIEFSASVVGGKKQFGKTQKVDAKLTLEINGETRQTGITIKNFTAWGKKGEFFDTKYEETEDLQWVFDRFEQLRNRYKLKDLGNIDTFLTYLIVNVTFLNKNGGLIKGKNKEMIKSIVNQNLMQDYIDFIERIFASYASVFIGSDLIDDGTSPELENTIIMDPSRGMVIPVYRILEKLQETIIDQKSSIDFKVVMDFKNYKIEATQLQEFRNKKLELAKGSTEGYPTPMIKEGRRWGEDAKNHTTIKFYLHGLYSLLNVLNTK